MLKFTHSENLALSFVLSKGEYRTLQQNMQDREMLIPIVLSKRGRMLLVRQGLEYYYKYQKMSLDDR